MNNEEELQLYRTVTAISGDIIYRYCMDTDCMELFYGRTMMSKYGSSISNYSSMIKNQSKNDEADNQIDEYLEAIKGLRGYFEYRVKLNFFSNDTHWYRITGKTEYDGNNQPISVVGKMTVEDELHTLESVSVSGAKHIDQLTGVYNKTGVKKQLALKCRQLAGAKSVLLDLSIDDIHRKCGNDERAQEQAVINVAQCIKRIFSYDACIGRVKAFDFTVFYYGNDPTEGFLSKLELLKKNINEISIAGTAEPLTVSGGIYYGPFEAGDEYEIREKAHMALTSARYRGKDVMVMYSDELEDAYNAYNRDIGVDDEYNNVKFDHQLVEKALDIVSGTGNIDEAVNLIFKKIGQKYHIDRIMVHEMNTRRHTVRVSYDWYNPDNIALKGRLSHEPLPEYEKLESVLERKDIIIVNDTRDITSEFSDIINNIGLKSFVQCAFIGQDDISGCVGFENYSGRHSWSQSEIKTFKLITQLVSSFLIRIRSYEEMLRINENNETHDILTGFLKYDTFLAEAQKYIEDNPNAELAVIYTGMKEFRRINSEYGFKIGDRILKGYSELFQAGEERFIVGSRINADNFIALVNLYDKRGNALSEAALDNFNRQFAMKYGHICPNVNLIINAGATKINDRSVPFEEYVKTAFAAREEAIADDNIIVVIK